MPFFDPKNQRTTVRRIGNRREPRVPVELAVRIFGTDLEGKVFSETVTTIEVSREGAKLGGVSTILKIGEIVGVTYLSNKIHCRVKWVGKAGTASAGQLGLINLTPEKPFWGLDFPSAKLDADFTFEGKDRRQSIRMKSAVSVELHPAGQPMLRTKIMDLSMGGCFVEVPSPLNVGAKCDIILWLGLTKLRLSAEVIHNSPGYGIGLRFLNISPQSQQLLQQNLTATN